jgi:fatty acid desaturase
MASARATDWRTLLLLAAMYALVIGNFAVHQIAPGPLVVHVIVAAIGIHLSFTVWHEGVHRNTSGRTWLNDAIGILGIFPYMAPYYVEKWFHLQHHTNLNQPEDPNRIYIDGPFWQIGFRYLRILRFARARLADDPRTRSEKTLDAIPPFAIAGLYGAAAWHGSFLDLVALWFVPLVLSKVVMDWYINYLPHVGLPPNRFHGTRIVAVGWFTPLVLCHNYHAIHHLWPDIPWHRYPSVFRARLGYLREHGVPIERRLVGFDPAGEGFERPDPLSG